MYSITQIQTGPPPAANRRTLASIFLHKNEVILLWRGLEQKDGIWIAQLIATRVPLTGGLQRELGRITIPSFEPPEALTGIAVGAENIYVAISKIGLVVFKEGRTQLLNEEAGLPSNFIEGLAWHKGRLYLGFDSAFAEFNPDKNQFRVLASARRLQKRNAFDGGTAYSVKAVLADDRRNCLWLGILNRTDQVRRGLWKFDTSAESFTHVLEMDYRGISNMIWLNMTTISSSLIRRTSLTPA
jgi:hypothetical protein